MFLYWTGLCSCSAHLARVARVERCPSPRVTLLPLATDPHPPAMIACWRLSHDIRTLPHTMDYWSTHYHTPGSIDQHTFTRRGQLVNIFLTLHLIGQHTFTSCSWLVNRFQHAAVDWSILDHTQMSVGLHTPLQAFLNIVAWRCVIVVWSFSWTL